jgi:hypothetical protein
MFNRPCVPQGLEVSLLISVMNHQAIIEQLSVLAPQLKIAESPETVLVKYASDRNLSPAQLERIGQVYNIAKTLNFMDKSANRGDSFRVLNTDKMMADFTTFKPQPQKEATNNTDWNGWFDAPLSKAASSSNPDDLSAWFDMTEKSAKIVESDGQYTVYSEDGSKRLSKPGTKAEAVKRLRQVEYFKKHKQANTVPNLMAMARDEEYAAAETDAVAELPKTAAVQIKKELREESFYKFELETAKQITDDSAEEARKIASELLEIHRTSPIPFAVMEHDAYYCSEDETGTKTATEFIANFFKSKGWDLERHDFSKGMPKLARDRHNILPLFNSLLEQLELHKSASSYVEELEKKSVATETERRRRTSTEEDIDFPISGRAGRRDAGSEDVEFPEAESGRRPSIIDLISGSKDKSSENSNKPKDTTRENLTDAKDIAKGLVSMYRPSNYLNKQTQDFVGNLVKAPEFSKVNKRQKEVDVAADDVGRVTELQRLLLTDPIIGEADPDTVVSLYNTLAKANPEIVKDKNLLRFALREALQYDAVPLHTYKDLISMGKDRADMQEKTQKLEDRKYTI